MKRFNLKVSFCFIIVARKRKRFAPFRDYNASVLLYLEASNYEGKTCQS